MVREGYLAKDKLTKNYYQYTWDKDDVFKILTREGWETANHEEFIVNEVYYATVDSHVKTKPTFIKKKFRLFSARIIDDLIEKGWEEEIIQRLDGRTVNVIGNITNLDCTIRFVDIIDHNTEDEQFLVINKVPWETLETLS